MQTYSRVCRVIGDLAGIDPASIGPGQCLGYESSANFYSKGARPLELDSLDRVTLAMKLEDEFKITLSDEEVDNPALDHVGGLVAFVQGKLDAKPQTYGDLAPALLAYCLEHPLPGVHAGRDHGPFDGNPVYSRTNGKRKAEVFAIPSAAPTDQGPLTILRTVFHGGFAIGKGHPVFSMIEADAAWRTFQANNPILFGRELRG